MRQTPLRFKSQMVVQLDGAFVGLGHVSGSVENFLYFAAISNSPSRELDTQVRYGLYCFAMFMGGLLVAGWIMWALRH